MDVFPNRPRSVTLTLWGVFLLGGWNCGRLLSISLNYRLLTTFSTTPTPLFRLVMALVWVLLLWAAVLALWQRRPFARHIIPTILIIYAIYELGLLLIFAQAGPARSGWLANTLFYLAIIVFSYWALNRTAVKSYFRD
jgi:hypothetical protein